MSFLRWPGIEVPVVAVIDQALGRDLALGGLVVVAGVVANEEALPAQQGGADGGEVIEGQVPHLHAEHAHALLHLGGGIVGAAEQLLQPRHEGLQVGAEEPAAVESGDELLHGEQGMDLGIVEPQAGELGLHRRLAASAIQTVAAQLAVEDDGHAQAIAHELDVAVQRRAGGFRPLPHQFEGHDRAVLQKLLDLVDALVEGHGELPFQAHSMRLAEGIMRFGPGTGKAGRAEKEEGSGWSKTEKIPPFSLRLGEYGLMTDLLADIRREVVRPWKFATFAIGLGLLILGAFVYSAPDWDTGVSVIMAGFTYLFSGWSMHVMVERRWRDWPLMIFLTWWCVDGSYALYWSFVNPDALAMMRDANWPASLSLYWMCGLIWCWRGSLRELAQCIRQKW